MYFLTVNNFCLIVALLLLIPVSHAASLASIKNQNNIIQSQVGTGFLDKMGLRLRLAKAAPIPNYSRISLAANNSGTKILHPSSRIKTGFQHITIKTRAISMTGVRQSDVAFSPMNITTSALKMFGARKKIQLKRKVK